MPKARLSRSLVAGLKPEAKPYEMRDLTLAGFLVRVQPSGRAAYYVEWARGKRKALGSTAKLTFEQARTQAHEMLGEAIKHGAPKLPTKADTTTFGDFIDKTYAPWAKANRKDGAATVTRLDKCYRRDLWGKPLAEINAWLVEKWRTKRLKQGISPATTNRDLAALKAALSKAVEWELLAAHPLAKVKRSKQDARKIVRFLTPGEELRMREALAVRDARIRAERAAARKSRGAAYQALHPVIGADAYGDHLTPAVLLSLNTGLRQGELLGLDWRSVSLPRRMLTVQAHTAKSSQERHVPLNAEALAVLTGWHAQRGKPTEGLLFPNREGRKISEIKTAWGALLDAAKVGEFRWHDMRHHFASKLVMAGVDLNTVRELLGHSDLKMTLRYAHLAPEHKAAAVEKLVAA